MVSFSLEVDGFTFRQAYEDAPEDFLSFSHHLTGAKVIFQGKDKDYVFLVDGDSLEYYQFEMPAGSYLLEFQMDQASIYGQQYGTFSSATPEVHISSQTKSVSVSIQPGCALFVVRDKFEILDQGIHMIERHSYANGFFTSYSLSKDSISGLYHCYFTPDPESDDPSAFLWFYEGEPGIEEGGLPTANLDIGTRYDIEILQ